jgi:hypothetical protein
MSDPTKPPTVDLRTRFEEPDPVRERCLQHIMRAVMGEIDAADALGRVLTEIGALHDQPWGFTWEMHDALYRQAQHRMGDTMQDTQDRARLLGVCRRIAALLPPREE